MWRNFKFNKKGFSITMTKETYHMVDEEYQLTDTETISVSNEFYTNYIASVDFFNNFFDYGAYCKAKMTKTAAGVLPTTVITVSPGMDTKIVARFEIRREIA